MLLAASLFFYAYGEPRFVFVLLLSVAVNYAGALAIDHISQNKKQKNKHDETDKQDHPTCNKTDYTACHPTSNKTYHTSCNSPCNPPTEGRHGLSKAPNDALRRLVFLSIIAADLGLLFLCKYLGFILRLVGCAGLTVSAGRLGSLVLSEIPLPLGISFFTFQAISYVADVYRGDVKAQKNPFLAALYIMFFPQLIAGPIVRYRTVEEQLILNERRHIDIDRFGHGAKRFLGGLFKKVLLANRLSALADAPFSLASFTLAPPAYLWLSSLAYSLQIFFDFSGYSDMAIGLGEMFGFRFAENFDAPYTAANVTDFWRRWHISLSAFFKDYVYIPLGGSRKGRGAQLRNLFIVWLLTGIWHGANTNFVLWGLAYFLVLAVEKLLARPWERGRTFRVFWRVCTLVFVNMQWVVFHADGVKQVLSYLAAMCGLSSVGAAAGSAGLCAALFGFFGGSLTGVDAGFDMVLSALRENWAFLLAGIVFCLPLKRLMLKRKSLRIFADTQNAAASSTEGAYGGALPPEKMETAGRPAGEVMRGCLLVGVYGALFLWTISYLLLGSHNPFIYFHF